MANKAGTKGGATDAKVLANLILYENKREEGKSKWVATGCGNRWFTINT